MTTLCPPAPTTLTAFAATTRIATGDRLTVALAARDHLSRRSDPVLVFDDSSGEQVELDLRGTAEEVTARITPPPAAAPAPAAEARGPGRPKLGVVAREVTLLPRHWDWLQQQSGGASVALRRLVEAARLASEGTDHRVRARDAAWRFATAIAGNRPHFEDAMRALFARDRQGFESRLAIWPPDLATHASALAAAWFADVKKTQ
jgi:hypothetical protein